MPRNDCIGPLIRAGIDYDDAHALRRIAMTLHRWHELGCGGSNDRSSWCVVRGYTKPTHGFEHEENGEPYIERHWHIPRANARPQYSRIPDRETGAKRRLAAILAKYPGLTAYIQGDPRGAALYILRPGDVPAGEDPGAYYSRGLAVYK